MEDTPPPARPDVAAHERESRFRLFAAQTTDALFMLDDQGTALYVNDQACASLGYRREELLGMTPADYDAELDEASREGIGMRLAAGELVALDSHHRRKDGSVFPVELRLLPFEEHGRRFTLALVRDISERKRVEAALRESEARYRAVHDGAALGIGLTDCDSNFVQVNPAFCEMLGYSEAELCALSRTDVTHPDCLAIQEEGIARVLAGELRSHTMRKRYLRKDGQVIWARTTVSLIRDAGGAAQHIISVIEDISERTRAEDALRESEARLAHIAAHAPGMVYQFVYRPDGTKGFTYVSEGSRTILGVEPEAALRDPAAIFDLVHPDDREEFTASGRAAVAARAPWRWEGRMVDATGEVRWAQVASRNTLQADGSILADGLLMDVTERRRTAQRLEESEQHYRSLFDHNPEAVYSLDPEGRFRSANHASELLSGYSTGALLGQSFEPLIVPEDVPTVMEHFRRSVAGTATHYNTTIRHRSGRRVRIGVVNIPIIVSGRVVGIFGIATDLTAKRELEAQLRQAQKLEAVGRLAGGVAHDFNNLLTVIRSYSSFVLEQLPTDGPVHADLLEVLKAGDRAAALTRQLLAFGRQQVLKPQRLDPNETVSSVAAMLRRVIGEDIRLETELAPVVWPVHADPGQLEQVLMNLAVNARDAMPSGGTLRLSTAVVEVDGAMAREGTREGLVPGQYAALIVDDTGVGIEPAELQKIFEPFYSTKGPGKGTGLGLATVYGIVKQSGGHVYVDSTPGAGCRFTVLLPRVEEHEEPGADPSPQPAPPRGTEVILLVEDEPVVRGAVRRQLERQGYAVLEASNGSEALALATSHEQIDLVLTDVVMPELNGRALVERLAVLRPGLRSLYMSGYTDDEILRRGLMRPDTAYLEKPFTLGRLADAVRRALDEPRFARPGGVS